MTETRESLLEHFRHVRAELMASIEGLSDARMVETTVDGWSVKDNLAHIACWDDLRADEITRMSAGHASALHMTPEQNDVFNDMMYQLRRGWSLPQTLWELQHSRQRLLDAIAAADSRAFDPSLYGEAGLRSTHDAQHAEYVTNWRLRMGY
jgi:hypothetical protein